MSFDNFQNDQNQNQNQNDFNQNQNGNPNNQGYQNYNPNNQGYQNQDPNNQGYQNYNQGGYQNYPPYPFMQKKRSGFDTASLACGIASLVLCCCTYLSILLGILGVVFALVGKNRCGSMSGMAIAGLICGIVGALLGVVSIVVTLAMGDVWQEMLNSLYSDLETGTSL